MHIDKSLVWLSRTKYLSSTQKFRDSTICIVISTMDYGKAMKCFTHAQVQIPQKYCDSFQILHWQLFKYLILKDTVLSIEI